MVSPCTGAALSKATLRKVLSIDRVPCSVNGPKDQTFSSPAVLTRPVSVPIIQGRMSPQSQGPFRPGDVVEVRPSAEILATLDEHGALDGMPFMPEMLQHVGRRFTVSRRVEKICDTIANTGSLRMRDAVYLEDLRCNGSGHGGCQAGCRIYWKEAWLRRADGQPVSTNPESAPQLEQRAKISARALREIEGDQEEVWRCQATEALKATEPLKSYDVRQYWRELASGNVALLPFLRVALRGLMVNVRSRMHLWKWIPLKGPGTQPSPREPLDLQPGDLVQVRSPTEIAPTLDANGRNLGLGWDRELAPYCGGTFRVQDRVQRIIDERTGRMIQISRDCIVLDGVVCSGEHSVGRWFCARQIPPYWREAWLRRAKEPQELQDEPLELHERSSTS